MPDLPRRPLLNPVLRFTKEPKPEGINARGKSAAGVRTERLSDQRRILAQQFIRLAEEAERRPQFDGQVILYAAMFDDSLATTWTPTDLFHSLRKARLLVPFRTGYLVEMASDQLKSFSRLVRSTDNPKDQVDISRIESVRFFEETDATGVSTLDNMWQSAPEIGAGRAFVIWLMPLRGQNAVEALIQAFTDLRNRVIAPPPQYLETVSVALGRDVPAPMRRSLQVAAATGDRFNIAVREYLVRHRARTTVVVPTQRALHQLIASGTVFRIEPEQQISSTSPGEGREPNRPLPVDMASLPIVGVVDGGMSAASYQHAEAWRAPPFIRDGIADTVHGNRVTSLVVQGHDWNNNLVLPPLYCQIGTVQAVPRRDVQTFVDTQSFIGYLDAVMAANPDTKVWNFSLNQREACQLDCVSPLGHDIAMLARKHRILPVISIGNKPGSRLQPPADCEAALTVGGRMHADTGIPAGQCPVSLWGPGPSSMLKPDVSNYSRVRALGGLVITGSSFSTALTSPLAAHTMQRLREASPDLVKALLLHNSDGDAFDPSLGFGTPAVGALPWECRPGFVTLQWTASLRPGAAFYWELPIPQSLRRSGKLRGMGSLTAILNPHPMITDYAGPNYFSVRLATALQFHRGKTSKGAPKYHNLLGSLDTDKIAEQDARTIDHKWSPIRHHKNEFRGVSFHGDTVRIYARIYSRDLYLYGYTGADEVPEMDTVFVLSIGTGDENDAIYNEIRDQLGAFVESATIETDIDVDNQ